MSKLVLSGVIAVPHPESHPVIDDSRVVHATDEKGQRILLNKKPVAIARDLISGKFYARVGESLPSNDADAKELQSAGAVHQPSQNPHLRGIWVPVAYFATKDEKPGSGSERWGAGGSDWTQNGDGTTDGR